jgi:hypothetical protein
VQDRPQWPLSPVQEAHLHIVQTIEQSRELVQEQIGRGIPESTAWAAHTQRIEPLCAQLETLMRATCIVTSLRPIRLMFRTAMDRP